MYNSFNELFKQYFNSIKNIERIVTTKINLIVNSSKNSIELNNYYIKICNYITNKDIFCNQTEEYMIRRLVFNNNIENEKELLSSFKLYLDNSYIRYLHKIISTAEVWYNDYND